MRSNKSYLLLLLLFTTGNLCAQTLNTRNESVYKLRPDDPEAVYFTSENFNIKGDGKMDVSEDNRYPEKYMIFFTSGIVAEGRQPGDAGAGTFYSAISNVDLKIEDGNPIAVGLRTHFAQHGFVSHMDIKIGKGKAGISEVGNELENIRFFGGDYGIIAGQTSPSWPVALIDTYFEGQRKAAIQCHNKCSG